MARGYHRLSFRARHILRQFGKAKNITLQRLHLHELRHAISRKHRFKGPKGKPTLGKPGLYQRLSRKGRKLIGRLRHSRSWSVQKQTVNELEREVARGERIALAKTRRAERWSQRAGRLAKGTRERGTRFRKWAQRKQEPMLARAERKQAQRPARRRLRLPHLRQGGSLRWRNGARRGTPYHGPFRSRSAHRRWARAKARRLVPRRVPQPRQAPAARTPRAPSAPRTARAPRSAPARTR